MRNRLCIRSDTASAMLELSSRCRFRASGASNHRRFSFDKQTFALHSSSGAGSGSVVVAATVAQVLGKSRGSSA
jgi:hypothetical protein